VRQRDRDPELFAEELTAAQFVAGIVLCPEERDCDGVAPGVGDLGRDRADGLLVEFDKH